VRRLEDQTGAPSALTRNLTPVTRYSGHFIMRYTATERPSSFDVGLHQSWHVLLARHHSFGLETV